MILLIILIDIKKFFKKLNNVLFYSNDHKILKKIKLMKIISVKLDHPKLLRLTIINKKIILKY